ncbi:hypothetical protein E4Z66_10265 [Aliishimia ponticola]|uniref:DUF6285 domain-containing protein n=1 Tax=Aliishimia ponticola TaxID=2499833 RepID=A0A4V3XKJ9_9RHOB|nr:DUF6285 domain-containing protein [Aliishimia ponticola]THH37293.1 hypothetical protein E4Z66_10265 [Aliishimia ponticola]
MQDHPTPDAILAAVSEWLRGTAAAALPAHARFEAKVAAGAVDLVRRQIAAQPSEGDEIQMLSDLVGEAGGVQALTSRLCAQIESGETDLSTPGLPDLLITTTLAKIDIDQPEFSAAARLRALAQRRKGMP